MVSVNTNVGAAVALQNLNSTNRDLNTVQNRLNTGLAVADARDNGAVFAIAQGLRADVGAFNAISGSLDRASSAVDVSVAAGTAVSDLLTELRTLALTAADASLDASSRASLNEDFTSLRDQITSIVTNADFNGVNLIDGTTANIQVTSDVGATSQITVAGENISLGGSILTLAASADISTQGEASTAIGVLDTSIGNVNNALARLGTSSKRLEIQNTFVASLVDSLEAGIGNLVDADLAEESAKLQSLQVQQQLGIQALSIANQAPQIVLSLFR